MCWRVVFGFYFQAEDGIRGLVRSRGLGDVYKRQREYHATERALVLRQLQLSEAELTAAAAVSYTPLTLPTSDLV